MSRRFGRNQKRAMRAEIAERDRRINSLQNAVAWANDRAKPFDAQRMLIDRLAGELGEKMRPYIEGMIRADERELPALSFKTMPDMLTSETIMQAHFDLRCNVRFQE